MTAPKTYLTWFLLIASNLALAQTATLFGVVLDEQNQPLPNVNIRGANATATTTQGGGYELTITADTKNTITFSHVGHEAVVLKDLILKTNETLEFNPVMQVRTYQIAEVEVTPTGERKLDGVLTVAPEVVRNIPGANAGVENILKLLPGVSFNNELSTQYNVRGGNFDENLVYVNGIEIYRPFLIRSAQQEGFSFINSNMISNLEFSAGGFQAKYGDKLSSVLDITYKIPSDFSLDLDASLLGISTTLESLSANKRWSSLTGVRYRNNALFINSLETQTNVNPTFVDAQTFLTFAVSEKLKLNFLAHLAINDYENEPLNRQTNFGTVNEPRALLVFYEGRENNRYQTEMAALQLDYLPTNDVKVDFTASVYHATEEEFSDIIAAYELGTVETNLESENLGQVTQSRGIGAQQNRARNQLDALIINLTHHGILKKGEKTLNWGLSYTNEDFRDQLRESEFLDSAGFFVRPPNLNLPNNQPEEPFDAPILAFDQVQATNFTQTNRVSAYMQMDNRFVLGNTNVYYNLGLRSQVWHLSGRGFQSNTQFLISPRAQLALKPNWQKDVLFRLAIGSYQQPALYRELRTLNGNINPEVEAQKSVHVVLGNEYSFNLWERPFLLTSELYYKGLTQVNPYTIEDVRIRYLANNLANAFAYGFDFRLNGALVPGSESWLSIGYLRTEENQNNRGFISRPTDSRLKLGLLFQDYMPTIPDLKLYLNLVYNTGVPGGSPNNEDPYDFQNRLRDYQRADLGISYTFAKATKRFGEEHWLRRAKALDIGFEIFNLFNNQNSITNTWVRDVDTQQQFAVPNFLTSRIFNIKLHMQF
ncbi:TonB-dependent Receptor [Croceitalea dokdonensis DOKDO 023]|uniref:TonB-dependent Receptor n=1 Tax=Croceitalea dokdonensis DOKDO 023 TaxID=1300341 RepID=A0A0P7AIU1_9FLAO|nr:TonB-dependent receptor plug domain-containing protein [Croceitalea dokdonensis]KPM31704.1 TonB-dependent Receptor [Croceitalea dokdonensis DOKDO 023]